MLHLCHPNFASSFKEVIIAQSHFLTQRADSISLFHAQSSTGCCYPALCLLCRVGRLCPTCTFALYLSFSLAGWLMLWLLIPKAIPARISKYKHSFPVHTFPSIFLVRRYEPQRTETAWATSPNESTPRERMKRWNHLMDDSLKLHVCTNTWKILGDWCKQTLLYSNQENHFWQPCLQPIKHKPGCVSLLPKRQLPGCRIYFKSTSTGLHDQLQYHII